MMSRAAFAVTKWRKYRSVRLYGTTMESIIDADLSHPNPPSSDTIVELMLLGDRQYMMATHRISLAAISHDSTHPFYKRVKYAFGYANSRRKKAGLSLNKWPIPICSSSFPVLGFESSPIRRLIWSLNRREVKAAHGMFNRFVQDGLVPFRVGSNGQASNRVTSFDATLCEILFKPGDSQ